MSWDRFQELQKIRRDRMLTLEELNELHDIARKVSAGEIPAPRRAPSKTSLEVGSRVRVVCKSPDGKLRPKIQDCQVFVRVGDAEVPLLCVKSLKFEALAGEAYPTLSLELHGADVEFEAEVSELKKSE